MKNLIKQTFGFLIILSIALSLFSLPATTYAGDETPNCSTDKYFDDVTKGMMTISGGDEDSDGTFVYQSFVITELAEPISAFDEVITDGSGITLSQVFLKYQCLSEETMEWSIAEGDTIAVKHDPPIEAYMYASYNATCPSGATCTYVQVLLAQSGTGLLKTYIAIIYRWAAGIVGIIAILVIVVSGIQISMDQGGGENVTSAKNRIMQSLAGLVILFLSGLILYTINPTFFTQ